MVSVLFSIICAIASPVVFGIMNVFDKYIVSKKVKNALSFAIIAAGVVFIFGVVLSLFLDWSDISIKYMIYPAIAGIINGSQYFLYYIVMQKEDASHFVGLFYTYPLVVALLSFLFLGEIISFWGYFGMFLILVGVVFLSIRIRKIILKASIWMIISMILCIAINEFLIKIATNNLPPLNGISINYIFVGLTVSLFLFHNKTRLGIKNELKNLKWALITETMTIIGGSTLYFAMVNIQATIVSSISAIQPLVVLFFERFVDTFIGKISRDHLLLPKLTPILLIVIGVILIYMKDVVSLLG